MIAGTERALFEIALGMVLLAAAVAAALGVLTPYVAVPIGLGTAVLIATLGLLLIAHGLHRRRLKRSGDNRHWVRSTGLMWTIMSATAALALAVPAAAPLLNAFKLAGFPAGFYMAAQGASILLVIVLFVFAARADVIDDQEGAREE